MHVSLIAIVTVAGIALAFSGLDVLRKLLGEHVRPLPLLVLLTAGSLPLWLVLAGWEGRWDFAAGYPAPATASILLNVVANLAFLQAVRVSPLSLTIPYLSLTPVFTTLLAVPILGERPAWLQVVGILLVVAGAFWLNVPATGEASLVRIGRAVVDEPGSLLMILTAFCWSLAGPMDKLAVEASSWPLHALVLSAGITVACLAILGGRGELRELRTRRWGLVGFAVVLTAIGLGLNLIALTLVWVGFIETFKRAVGSVLALFWGRVIFSEAILASQILAVLLMGLGVGLILW